ncbi:tRNA modification GTPase [Protomyces lactucae-debilis]|uniref:tRNA modification GTPase n=1 Tax=Protomyces lactucae-debilis TaxID=2754530 RepID=A0A1Y2FGP6_PROLT|nr:tRNA modification GTPase [Protomyces lactucae-debilis]ORY82584.1 tRNA modification GTPase [Protomyces lactucae-debilis]
MSTIYALSTSAAKAAIAVIRISGPQARLALAALTPKRVKPRQAHLVKLRHQGQLLDEALAFYMPGPASFTGEDSVELHVHGGKAVIRSVLAALSSHKGLRYAEPGEFSKRAFRAGKLDLTQAEALADLIHAETEQQRRAAVSQAAGALAKRYDGWREQLIQGRAMLEAVIDFGEDNEIDSTVVEQVQQRVRQLQEAIRNHLEAGVRGERLKHGITVALFGPPNAGKSSLLNLLCRREVSIVSDEAGTTRDVVETMLDIGGYPVILCDTAGLRDAQGFVEQQGVRLANMRVEEADLRLCVVPAGEAMDPLTQALVTPETMLVVNKVDLRSDARQGHHLSCTTHAGVDAFLAALTGRLQALTSDEHGQGLALGTTARHREQCERCLEHLDIFLRYDTHGFDFVLAAEELRYAGDCLGRVLGRIDVEELLSVIFRDFCIGK